ncbi:hypothetical protein RIEGSTA812A_PEG_50 [invertebrate metagenome]|uniref:Uncharacterized protein n=1 Tax=invertebrate metagenome TaxID=1711999 RepID=A0A484H4H3_9ZZZZ
MAAAVLHWRYGYGLRGARSGVAPKNLQARGCNHRGAYSGF